MLIKEVLYITFTIICMAIAIIDIQKQKIYNEAVAVLLVPAIVSFFVCSEVSVVSRLFGAVSVSGWMLMTCLLLPGAFGGGDIKLMVPVGLFLGVKRAMAAWVLAVFIGGIWGSVMVVWEWLSKSRSKKGNVSKGQAVKGREFPFAPALCIGSLVVLWGGNII